MHLPSITTFAFLSLLPVVSAKAGEDATFLELPYRYVIGGHSATSWLNSEEAGRKLQPGTSFNVFSLKGREGRITGGEASPVQDVCPDVWLAVIDPEIEVHTIAVSASWNPMPRIARAAGVERAADLKAVAGILASKGINDAKVKITQNLHVDLNDDGEEEVLLSATFYQKEDSVPEASDMPPGIASAGNYSFVALLRMKNQKSFTQILAGEFYPEAQKTIAPSVYKVGGLLDLDGDGALEIILYSTYYEGGSTTVWKLGPKKATKVLEVDCGV